MTAEPGLLVVSGRKPEMDGKRYLHRGIQPDSFEHRFALTNDIEVREAQIAKGLLTIELARVVPQAAAPRRIAITSTPSSAQSRGGSELRLVR